MVQISLNGPKKIQKGPKWSKCDNNLSQQFNLVNNCHKWCKRNQNGPTFFLMVQNGHYQSRMVKNGTTWSKMVKNYPNGSNIVQKGPTIVKNDTISSNLIQNHPKWSKVVQNGPKITKDQAGHSLHLQFPSRYFLYYKDFLIYFIFVYVLYIPNYLPQNLTRYKYDDYMSKMLMYFLGWPFYQI